ncbi:methyltransferase domain-containing protein [Kaistia algarum]|uniref:methyltransferase domain-containing protein n=1 Tax=Kaistia algarum TaxID=2083279 RepID=UPI001402BFD8|nr:class I SAM-dependent methyltransferase [Kaistia algarum]MCX5512703.1 class I SAM-dependent methyltransferase [Kaistia algarum]
MNKHGLSAEAQLLGKLMVTSATESEFVARFVTRGFGAESEARRMFQAAVASGLIAPIGANVQPNDYSETYATWRSQRGMISDHARTTTFRRGIEALCTPDTVVIDVGSGSGILSLFAARAGAKQVYALELTGMIEDAKQIAADNGYADTIQFIRGDASEFQCPEPATLVLGEWAGMFLIDEHRHYDAFCSVRDRCLAPGGAVLPGRASMFLAPIDNSQLSIERGFGFWKNPIHGFDFSVAARRLAESSRRIIAEVRSSTLLGEYQIASIDCTKGDSRDFFFETEFEHHFTAPSACQGFAGYFNLELAPGILVDTSPYAKFTHWQQSYFPIEELFLSRGETLVVRVKTFLDPILSTVMMELKIFIPTRDTGPVQSYTYPINNIYS